MTKRTIFDAIESDWARGNWKASEAFEPAATEKATEGAPGSKQKIRAMVERINSGQDLFHPGDFTDAKYEG